MVSLGCNRKRREEKNIAIGGREKELEARLCKTLQKS